MASGSPKKKVVELRLKVRGWPRKPSPQACHCLQECLSTPPYEWSFLGCTWTPEQGQPGCLAPSETRLHPWGSPSGNLNGYGKGVYLSCSLGMLFSQVKGKAQLNKTLQGWNKIISISEYSSLSKHNLVHKLCVRMGKPLIFGLYIPCRAVRDPRGDLDHPDHRWVSPVLKLKFMCQLETSITQRSDNLSMLPG